MNSTINNIISRRSIRDYKEQEISKTDLDLIKKSLKESPSWTNSQLFSAIFIKDKETKKQIAKICFNQKQIESADVFIMFVADIYKINKLAKANNQDLSAGTQNLNTLLVANSDASFAMQNVMIAAQSLNLATCPIGAVRIDGAFEKLTKLLNLPDQTLILNGLVLGVPKSNVYRKPKQDDLLIFEEKYDKQRAQKLINEFNSSYKDKINKLANTSSYNDYLTEQAKWFKSDEMYKELYNQVLKSFNIKVG